MVIWKIIANFFHLPASILCASYFLFHELLTHLMKWVLLLLLLLLKPHVIHKNTEAYGEVKNNNVQASTDREQEGWDLKKFYPRPWACNLCTAGAWAPFPSQASWSGLLEQWGDMRGGKPGPKMCFKEDVQLYNILDSCWSGSGRGKGRARRYMWTMRLSESLSVTTLLLVLCLTFSQIASVSVFSLLSHFKWVKPIGASLFPPHPLPSLCDLCHHHLIRSSYSHGFQVFITYFKLLELAHQTLHN